LNSKGKKKKKRKETFQWIPLNYDRSLQILAWFKTAVVMWVYSCLAMLPALGINSIWRVGYCTLSARHRLKGKYSSLELVLTIPFINHMATTHWNHWVRCTTLELLLTTRSSGSLSFVLNTNSMLLGCVVFSQGVRNKKKKEKRMSIPPCSLVLEMSKITSMPK
jgi:hypothetical protein